MKDKVVKLEEIGNGEGRDRRRQYGDELLTEEK